MKAQNTYVEYTRSELDAIPDETDWDRVDALTDEEIDAESLSDADDPPTDETLREGDNSRHARKRCRRRSRSVRVVPSLGKEFVSSAAARSSTVVSRVGGS